jgi:hypothetical protein
MYSAQYQVNSVGPVGLAYVCISSNRDGAVGVKDFQLYAF